MNSNKSKTNMNAAKAESKNIEISKNGLPVYKVTPPLPILPKPK